ncbi:hypothetical protein [Hymenobacter metallilatus]|uniref:Uncharacterized protein n=1 Tax=Hymenobacter metallilatus TaxID=2493666 RepID=A0A428JRW6_9BACT|nr:hypothetical protein [Hymenobacter metallilatus]RSK36257.1 hypothetical protein EI290_05070 [Hymenobacter metallilatus]
MQYLRVLGALSMLSGLWACSESPNRGVPATSGQAAADTAAVRQAALTYRIHYNTPVNLDSTAFYYQPVSVVPLEQATRSRILSSSSYESDYERGNGIEGTCFNLLFFQKSTLQEYALLPHSRFVISEIDTDLKPDTRWPFLFYTIIKADFNADGDQDENDASALFASDRSGRQLRQLTPDNTQLKNRLILPNSSLLLVEVRPDLNKDRKFTAADGSYWLRFNLQNLAAAPVRQPAAARAATLQQQMLQRQSSITH